MKKQKTNVVNEERLLQTLKKMVEANKAMRLYIYGKTEPKK